jgi:hypothetical protein
MSMVLPRPVAAFFAAEREGDVKALGRCFTADAEVRDEGRTMKGIPAIKKWHLAAKEKYHHTVLPIGVVERGGKTVVLATVAGDFPGSPLNLEHIFGLRGRKIASLTIG